MRVKALVLAVKGARGAGLCALRHERSAGRGSVVPCWRWACEKERGEAWASEGEARRLGHSRLQLCLT